MHQIITSLTFTMTMQNKKSLFLQCKLYYLCTYFFNLTSNNIYIPVHLSCIITSIYIFFIIALDSIAQVANKNKFILILQPSASLLTCLCFMHFIALTLRIGQNIQNPHSFQSPSCISKPLACSSQNTQNMQHVFITKLLSFKH